MLPGAARYVLVIPSGMSLQDIAGLAEQVEPCRAVPPGCPDERHAGRAVLL